MLKKISLSIMIIGTFLTLFKNGFSQVKAANLMEINVSSIAFQKGSTIPLKYVCDRIPKGKNVSIPLKWASVPAGTKSFAMYMYDLNPVAKDHIHWFVTNIPISVTSFNEGISRTKFMPTGSLEFPNTSGSIGYEGPCPPKGTGNHQYKVVILALNVEEFKPSGVTTLANIEASIQGKVLAKGEISGYYQQ